MTTKRYLGKDRLGNDLFDGDIVLSFNIFAKGERWPLTKPKKGVLCKIIWIETQPYISVLGWGKGSTGCRNPENKTFGAEKVMNKWSWLGLTIIWISLIGKIGQALTKFEKEKEKEKGENY